MTDSKCGGARGPKALCIRSRSTDLKGESEGEAGVALTEEEPAGELLAGESPQRKRSAAVVREQDERLRLLLEAANVALWDWDLKTNRVQGGLRPGDAPGYSLPAAESTYSDWYQALHPDDRPRVLAAFQSHLEGELPRYESEHRVQHTDGSYRWVFVRGVAIRDEEGRPVRMIGSEIDVTDRRQAEEQARREEQLLRSALELYECERRVVAYEIHDGLAQELTGALFALQALGQLPDKNSPESQRFYQSALQWMTTCIEETRRLIRGLRPATLDESGVVAALRALVQELSQRGGAEIAFCSEVHFDRLASPLENALYRIAQEALTNAVRYSQSARIEVRLQETGGRVRLSVEDWGSGFDPQAVDANHFGLRGIRERVELLGGQARIDSRPGAGTRIRVDLPLIELPPEALAFVARQGDRELR